VVIEAELDKTRGPVATVLVQKGTVRIGEPSSSACTWAYSCPPQRSREKILGRPSHAGRDHRCVGRSAGGRSLQVVGDEKRRKSPPCASNVGVKSISAHVAGDLEDLYRQIKGRGQRAQCAHQGDVQGSAQAVRDALEKQSTSEVRVRVIQERWAASLRAMLCWRRPNAIIIGFNVRPTPKASELAERRALMSACIRLL
jgi:translation initiation factor IF-2